MSVQINLTEAEIDNYIDNIVAPFPSLNMVKARELGRSLPIVDDNIPLSTSETLFFSKLEALRSAKKTNKEYCIARDKGAYIVYHKLDAAVQKTFRVYYRTEKTSFLETTRALDESEHLVATNGPFYEFDRLIQATGYYDAKSEPLDANETINVGTVYVDGSIPSDLGYRESDLGYHIQHNIGNGLDFYFGNDDASGGNAISGLNPILIHKPEYGKVWKYGIENLYDDTVSDYGDDPPKIGDPGDYAPALIQRSNGAYDDVTKRDGKNIIAFNPDKSCMVSIIQNHFSSADEEKGYNLDYYRDNLFRLGCTNALTLDGSNSVMLYDFSKKSFLVTPAIHKYNSQTVGVTHSK